jgi:hypothetical protein
MVPTIFDSAEGGDEHERSSSFDVFVRDSEESMSFQIIAPLVREALPSIAPSDNSFYGPILSIVGMGLILLFVHVVALCLGL